MDSTAIKPKHPPIVHRAKAFLQLGLGMTEPDAHRTLQYFASGGNIKLSEAAEIVCRLERAASLGRRG